MGFRVSGLGFRPLEQYAFGTVAFEALAACLLQLVGHLLQQQVLLSLERLGAEQRGGPEQNDGRKKRLMTAKSIDLALSLINPTP